MSVLYITRIVDTLNLSELKKLKLPAIKQKVLDLGLDTKGSKAELLVTKTHPSQAQQDC